MKAIRTVKATRETLQATIDGLVMGSVPARIIQETTSKAFELSPLERADNWNAIQAATLLKELG